MSLRLSLLCTPTGKRQDVPPLIAPVQVRNLIEELDADRDGRISLQDLRLFMGQSKAVIAAGAYDPAKDSPLEARLRRVIAKAEQMGTPLEAAFAHFDKVGPETRRIRSKRSYDSLSALA